MSHSATAVCKIIKYKRGYNRLNTRHKTITSLMFYEENMKIKAVTHIRVNLKTGTVTAAGCITMGQKSISPCIFGKQNCNDPVFIEKISNQINVRRRQLRAEKKSKN